MNSILQEQLVSGKGTGDIFKDEALAREYDGHTSMVWGEQFVKDIGVLLGLTTYRPTDVVVDLGCGTGISTQRLLEKNPGRVICLDPSEPMLEQARIKFNGRGNIEFGIASAEKLSDSVRGEEADKVVSANVFQYFSDPDKVLEQICIALNPNGEYLFNVLIKAPEEMSIYFPFFRAVEKAMSKEFGKKVQLPELKGFKPKYERKDLEELAARNGFAISRYEEKPIIIRPESLRATYKLMLDSMKTELVKNISPESTERIIKEVQIELNQVYTKEGYKAGTEAFVCLRKST